MKKKLVFQKEIPSLIKKVKKQNKTIVFTNGCFYLIHPGHIKLLSKAKSKGDILIAGINSDSSIRKIKGKNRPILNQKARIEILSALIPIDYIVIFSSKTPLNLIKKIAPDVLVKGKDWENKKIVGEEVIKANSGEIHTIKLEKGFSTTDIIKEIAKKYG